MKTSLDEIYKKKGRLYVKPHGDLAWIKVYGIDSSKEAIKLAKEWLKEENLKANLKIGDIFQKIPWENGFLML